MKKGAFVVVPVVLVAVALTMFWLRNPNLTIVRNSSDKNVTAVQLDVQEHGGTKTFSTWADSLAPGESVALRHNLNDSKVRLTFTLNGEAKEHFENYADLWRGQGWLINVQPGGKIQSGYESSNE